MPVIGTGNLGREPRTCHVCGTVDRAFSIVKFEDQEDPQPLCEPCTLLLRARSYEEKARALRAKAATKRDKRFAAPNEKARYFGAECVANPGSSLEEYKPDLARVYGYSSWSEMPSSVQSIAMREFVAGKKGEK